MNDTHNDSPNPTDKPATATDAGLSRRRLVRAGLAAAPVMAALKSNSVLAGGGAGGNCIRPSTFSSIDAARGGALSRNPRAAASGTCRSPSDWRGALPEGYSQVMFLAGGLAPADNSPGRGKDQDDKKGGGNGHGNTVASTITSPFTKNWGRLGNKSFDQVTLGEVLASDLGDPYAKLSRYVAAAYLSHLTHDGWLELREIKAMWEGGGNWVTTTNEEWDMTKTLAFFEAVYYPAPFADR